MAAATDDAMTSLSVGQELLGRATAAAVVSAFKGAQMGTVFEIRDKLVFIPALQVATRVVTELAELN